MSERELIESLWQIAHKLRRLHLTNPKIYEVGNAIAELDAIQPQIILAGYEAPV